MQYSSSFSRSLPSPASSLPPLSDGDSATLSDSTNDDPQDQLGYLGTSSLALSAILDPKFPHSAEVFGNWLKTLYIRGFIEDSTYSRIRIVRLTRKKWDKIREYITTTDTGILQVVHEELHTLVLTAMTEVHTKGVLIVGSSIQKDLTIMLGQDVVDHVQFSGTSATFKAVSREGRVFEQIPDYKATIQRTWLDEIEGHQDISVDDPVLAKPPDCFRLEVCNSEDARHGIHKMGCWNTIVGVTVPNAPDTDVGDGLDASEGAAVEGSASEGAAAEGSAEDEEEGSSESEEEEGSATSQKGYKLRKRNAEAVDRDEDEPNIDEEVFKVLANIPLFILNFDRRPPSSDLDKAVIPEEGSGILHFYPMQSSDALCCPMASEGKLRTGETFVQLLAFSGQEALNCLRQGAKERWSLEDFVQKGYGCHVVEDYNTDALRAERDRFWPNFTAAMERVRAIVVFEYLRTVRISQLRKQGLTLPKTLQQIQKETIVMDQQAKTTPVSDPLHDIARTLRQALIDEQCDKIVNIRLTARPLKRRHDDDRRNSPEIVGIREAIEIAGIASPRHARSTQDMAAALAQAVQDSYAPPLRRVRRRKEGRIEAIQAGAPTTIPLVGPYLTDADIEQEADEADARRSSSSEEHDEDDDDEFIPPGLANRRGV